MRLLSYYNFGEGPYSNNLYRYNCCPANTSAIKSLSNNLCVVVFFGFYLVYTLFLPYYLSTMKEPIKIILADDHPVVLEGMRSFLERDKELQIVGTAANGQEVLQLIQDGVIADIILSDIDMPVMSGNELTKKLRELKDPPKMLMLAMHDHEQDASEAFKAGADGYICKYSTMEEMVFALKYIKKEGSYICQTLARTFIVRMKDDFRPVNPANLVEFSERELEMLSLIADGYTNQEIAYRIFTSRRTVEGYRLSLIVKTGVRNTAALVKYALQHSMIH